MIMNAKKFRSVLGGVVKESVENDSPVIREIIGCVTSRIAELKTMDGKDSLDPSVEISRLIDRIAAKSGSVSTNAVSKPTKPTGVVGWLPNQKEAL